MEEDKLRNKELTGRSEWTKSAAVDGCTFRPRKLHCSAVVPPLSCSIPKETDPSARPTPTSPEFCITEELTLGGSSCFRLARKFLHTSTARLPTTGLESLLSSCSRVAWSCLSPSLPYHCTDGPSESRPSEFMFRRRLLGGDSRGIPFLALLGPYPCLVTSFPSPKVLNPFRLVSVELLLAEGRLLSDTGLCRLAEFFPLRQSLSEIGAKRVFLAAIR